MHNRQFARISPVSYSHKASKFLPAWPRSFLRATKYLIDQAMSAPGTGPTSGPPGQCQAAPECKADQSRCPRSEPPGGFRLRGDPSIIALTVPWLNGRATLLPRYIALCEMAGRGELGSNLAHGARPNLLGGRSRMHEPAAPLRLVLYGRPDLTFRAEPCQGV